MTRFVLACLLLLSPSLHAQTSARSDKTGAPATSKPGRAAVAGKQTWEIDVAHSELNFSLRHLINRVKGRFKVWSGTLAVAPDNWNNGVVDVVIQASSIDTENEERDAHLRTEDFFEVEKYPEIVFKSTSVKRTGDSMTVAGNLTMKGVTKPVVLTGKFTGAVAGQKEKPRMNFHATTTINRMDYGISYNRVLEGGGTTLGDEVTIEVVVSAVRQ